MLRKRRGHSGMLFIKSGADEDVYNKRRYFVYFAAVSSKNHYYFIGDGL